MTLTSFSETAPPLRLALRRGHRVVQGVFEGFWAAAFSARALLPQRHVARWRSDGRREVSIVAPHPDDEVYGCGGTAFLHRRSGDRLSICVVTDGRRSGAFGLPPGEMARQRRLEAEAAAAQLDGCHLEWLGLLEGGWESRELEVRLARLWSPTPPDVVYVPSGIDFHPEHVAVAGALARTLCRLTPPPTVRVMQLQVPLTSSLINLVADTSAVARECRAALEAHRTQLGTLVVSQRQKRYAARRFGFAVQGEEFWELSAAEYERLHRLIRRQPWRGLRPFAWTDPMAYLLGRRERRRLAAAVEGPPGG